MSSSPDIAGFKAAQSRLRSLLGTPADFKVYAAATYPPGTQLDPETGRPYDPTIRPLTADVTTITRTVGVVARTPNARANDTETNWSGLRRGDTVLIEMDVAAWADVEAATEVSIKGMDFSISAAHEDPGLDDRVIATLELK